MIIENKEQIQEALEQITSAKVNLEAVLAGTGVSPAPTPKPDNRKLHIILDAGHGSIHPVTGQYMTNPKDGKFYKFLDYGGFTAYEGQTNRLIADRVANLLEKNGYGVTKVYHEYIDTSMSERVMRANQVAASLPSGIKPLFLSYHSNAFGASSAGKSLDPKGWSAWIFPDSKMGLMLADELEKAQVKVAGNSIEYRVHGKYPKKAIWEANFQVLRTTTMPACLIENLFFTNIGDAKMLYSIDYQNRCADAALMAVSNLESKL